jgi:SAM-dependent methyltransferase
VGFYQRHIEPRLVDFACSLGPISRQRAKVAPLARGRVLEVGFGGGRNLPFYDAAKVSEVIGLEPSPGMRALAAPRIAAAPFKVELIGLKGEEIPLDAASVDTVLVTYTLCTIPDVGAALAGMRRVLKPDGRFLFCEHGLAPDPGVARWQARLDRPWRAIAGGCRLNRDIGALIAAAGFNLGRTEAAYLPRTPRFVGYQIWGEAAPA